MRRQAVITKNGLIKCVSQVLEFMDFSAYICVSVLELNHNFKCDDVADSNLDLLSVGAVLLLPKPLFLFL